jgi:outer membrane immunogenic protein
MNPFTHVSIAVAHCGRLGMPRRGRGLCVGFTALTLALFVQSAAAADLGDTLRGSFAPQFSTPTYSNWSGVYFGGQLGVSSAAVNYADSLSSLTGFILRESLFQDTIPKWQTMGKESVAHVNYGAFLGYNLYQQDQIVLGVEANYSRADVDSYMADSISRVLHDDTQAPSGHHYYFHTTVAGSAAVHITDVATLRARAGWSAGQFLPYAFGGLAIGRANYYRSATVSYWTEDKPDATNPPTAPNPPPYFNCVDVSGSPVCPSGDPAGTKSESQSNAIAYGAAVGLGVEVSILPNMFLRAEWEYVQFAPIHDIQVNINSARVGLGLKF